MNVFTGQKREYWLTFLASPQLTGGPMTDRSPTEVIHGIIEEQRERQRKQESTQPDSVSAENYARVVADVP